MGFFFDRLVKHRRVRRFAANMLDTQKNLLSRVFAE